MQSQVRLYAILARESSTAVVFRRGPSKQVQLIKWNTDDDTFEFGQWFKGRIYERRCDLSPNGKLLIYFAATYKQPLRSWSALSRPPYLTALALWPKGDGWGGGGLFGSNEHVQLNHREGEMKLADGFPLPKWFRVKPLSGRPGWGEDDPIWSMRLERDGWKLTGVPGETKFDFKARIVWDFSTPIAWEKQHPKQAKRYSLRMEILGIKERDSAWYITEHTIQSRDSVLRLGSTDWADWAHNGDLLYAQDGRLFRVPCKGGKLSSIEDRVELVDLRTLKFQALKAPEEALRWPMLK